MPARMHMYSDRRSYIDVESMPSNTLKIKTIKRFGAAHQIVAVLVALSIFLVQALPVSASHTAGADGNWIEICSDGGVKLIRLGTENPMQDECNHCSFCLIPFNNLQGNLTPQPVTLISSEFTYIFYSDAHTISLAGPEQYWSTSRGPPVACIDYKMNTLFSLLNKEQVLVVSSAWSIPCL